MKFSEQWLREWVDPDMDTQALAEELTMAGLEVDGVEPAAAAFEQVVVGLVRNVEPHPQADRLRLCRVDVGEGEPLSIVCGAANVAEGMRVPTAKVGAVLPGGLKIKKAKLRGVESFGMLCSAKELGLADSAEGLMPLPGDAPVGADVRQYLHLNDAVIEVDFTPNRGDCLSVLGIAREVGVLTCSAVKDATAEEIPPQIDDTFPIEVDTPGDCPRYVGRVVRGIDPQAETPVWMQERLRRAGLRSLSPVVDITNYVLLELGQPMHAFDLAKLDERILVRRARTGERLTLLDGREVSLDDDLLVIADHHKPVALAGIMGGQDSAVGQSTVDILLESAFFDPDTVRGKGRRFALQTDSSYRFERGVDPGEQRRAMERATALVMAIAGGRPGPVVEVESRDQLPTRHTIELRHDRLNRLLGVIVPGGQVEDILCRLGMNVEPFDHGWLVKPPPFRFDIALEADLIEEVGRVFGYANVPSAMPVTRMHIGPRPEGGASPRTVRHTLAGRGYREAITYSFVDPRTRQALDPEGQAVALANPISSEMAVMRTNLWAGLVKALHHNLNRQQERVRLFETGLRFRPGSDGLAQEAVVAGIACGSAWPEQWGASARAVDFYDVKGDLEALMAAVGDGDGFEFETGRHPALHPGQTAEVKRGGRHAGWLGTLHPSVAQALELPAGVVVFELLQAALAEGAVPEFAAISKFPSIRRDLALVVAEEVTAQSLVQCVKSAGGRLLRDVHLFDIYRGKGITEGKKSVALGFTLQDEQRTLTDEEVEAVVAEVVTALGTQVGASLRE